MNFKRKIEECVTILKSGIVGALALTGICIILFIIAFAARTPLISYLYSKTLARCSLEEFFAITSCFGFILGLIVRRRLPIIQKGIVPMAIAAIQ